ncbi:unnamed protein product [Symbiodinium pilosum]|uniref:Nitrogen permease regulator 2 n=1 Tax=Symbiodinium pilosum TaxID=2952 RepID=A0A812ITX1_SYMPI|nr:unnamed protein product [Symbiodinium pilosum]
MFDSNAAKADAKCHLDALLFCVFDKDAGPIVQCADPPGAGIAFQQVGHYLLPDSTIKGRVVSIVCGDRVMMGTPVYIEDAFYHRNSFQFNVCMVIDSSQHHEPYRDVAQLLAMSFHSLEVDTRLLSNPRDKISIQDILARLRLQINDAEECFVRIDMSHAISFKVRRWVPALTKIEDDTLVPVPMIDLHQLYDNTSKRSAAKLPALPFSLDPAVAEVLPLINGVSSVQCIARNCALRSDYVVMILRHLLHFNLIRLIPDIRMECKYRLTPAYHTVLEDAALGQQAVHYVTGGKRRVDNLPDEEQDAEIQKVMALYALLACEGQDLGHFQQVFEKDIKELQISLRHFMTWGLLQGYLERVEEHVGSLNKAEADELFRLRTRDIPQKKPQPHSWTAKRSRCTGLQKSSS